MSRQFVSRSDKNNELTKCMKSRYTNATLPIKWVTDFGFNGKRTVRRCVLVDGESFREKINKMARELAKSKVTHAASDFNGIFEVENAAAEIPVIGRELS